MCVIVLKPKGANIAKLDLEDMFAANPDGAGLAYYKGRDLIVKKGLMKVSQVIAAMKPLTNYEVVLHFRYATHGTVNELQTHPFLISDETLIAKGKVNPNKINSALFHNGIIHNYGTKTLSDTLHFVTQTLSQCQHTQLKIDVLSLIGDKFALLEHGKIYLVGDWQQYGACKVSNMHWQWSYGVAKPAKRKSKKSWLFADDDLPSAVTDGHIAVEDWQAMTDDEKAYWIEDEYYNK